MVFLEKRIRTLFCILVVFLVVDLWGIALLYRHNVLIRFISVEDLNDVHPKAVLYDKEILLKRFKGGDPAEIMKKVMNAVHVTQVYPSHELDDMLTHIDHGGGLGCSGMAALYSAALSDNGFENRTVVLLRNVYSVYDAHTVVEVYEDQRWVVYDPTFNVSFTKDGQKIGALEISQTLYDGSEDEIRIEHFGEVSYPARLDTYYMNWQPLYNNVFILDRFNVGLVEKVPPFRYWLGPVYYLQPLHTRAYVQPHWYQFHQQYYFVFVVVLPVLVIVLTALLFYGLIHFSINKSRQKACT